MGLRDDLKRRALGFSQRALETLMADEKRATQVAAAVGTLQKGKQALERGQNEFIRALNYAGRADYKALGKRFSSLKRRLRALETYEQGRKAIRIAEALGGTRGAVSQWLGRARAGGREALRRRKPASARPRLMTEQRANLPRLLAKGAESYGFIGDV